MFIYLDIETLPSDAQWLREELAKEIHPPGNMSKPETIAKWEADCKPGLIEEALKKTGLDGGYGAVCCVAIAVDDYPVHCRLSLPHDGEKGLIESLVNTLSDYVHKAPVLIGHNIQFDLRFLLQRCAVNGIYPGPILYAAMNAKPWDKCLADTMLMWHPKSYVGLSKLCKILGIPKEDSVDGSQVADLWKAGDFKAISSHCESDVNAVREVHRRLTFRKAA